SPPMLEVARRKGVARTVVADALQLPFSDGSFDCVTVAFGLRNMRDWGAALREMARVLAPGGHLLVLDFSIPAGALRPLYRAYLHHCLPRLAAVVTGQKDAYEYLGASIEQFPSGTAMTALIEQNGFCSAKVVPFRFGIAIIYTAVKA
ncbi:MAG: class I SAM-dependent methyltransferase, partial [Chthoniobacterales bacterium]|nr:class I SAM-dependent methyltransferase [Chthoniobacterales bacterium]